MNKRPIMTFSIVLILSTICFADTIHVPGDQPTIQAGIDAAINGDTILVAQGSYFEMISFNGKNIILTSEQGPENTMIDAGGAGTVLTFDGNEGPSACVNGFTLKNGQAIEGGGIYCMNSDPTITNNIIENNTASECGGGIYCIDSSPSIMSNILRDNQTSLQGGAICCEYGRPLIADNEISNNYSNTGGGGIAVRSGGSEIRGNIITNNEVDRNGGGIFAFQCDTTRILENTISGNHTNLANASGGGIYISSANAYTADNIITYNSADNGAGVSCGGNEAFTMERNEIAFNTAKYNGGGIECGFSVYVINYIIQNHIVHNEAKHGGGVFFDLHSRPMFTGNTIAENTAVTGGGLYMAPDSYSPAGIPSLRNNQIVFNTVTGSGGGIFCDDAYPKLINTTIADNSANLAGGGLCLATGAIPVISNSIFWNNNAPQDAQIHLSTGEAMVSFTDILGGWPGTGNIMKDPLFVDAGNGDYHLTYDSPCRDTGDNTTVKEAADIEGDPRIAFGVVDMGADEFSNHLYCIGDFTPGGSIEGKFVGLPGSTPVALFLGSAIMDPPLSHKWGDFYLEAPWLLFPLVPIPANGVLEIPATISSSPAPYDIPLQALIGWKLSNLFVVEVR